MPAAASGLWIELTERIRQYLAARLDFTLADLGYRFPEYPLPPGETPHSFLRQITWNGALARFRPLTARAQAQITKELAMIEKLDLAGYFLIVWDIVNFCRQQDILVQGRGSAANSAVCYSLGITAVDPVGMDLLFERFLSEERGEWPDIDLDLPSGDEGIRVLQLLLENRELAVLQLGDLVIVAFALQVLDLRARAPAEAVVVRVNERLGRWTDWTLVSSSIAPRKPGDGERRGRMAQ